MAVWDHRIHTLVSALLSSCRSLEGLLAVNAHHWAQCKPGLFSGWSLARMAINSTFIGSEKKGMYSCKWCIGTWMYCTALVQTNDLDWCYSKNQSDTANNKSPNMIACTQNSDFQLGTSPKPLWEWSIHLDRKKTGPEHVHKHAELSSSRTYGEFDAKWDPLLHSLNPLNASWNFNVPVSTVKEAPMRAHAPAGSTWTRIPTEKTEKENEWYFTNTTSRPTNKSIAASRRWARNCSGVTSWISRKGHQNKKKPDTSAAGNELAYLPAPETPLPVVEFCV